MRRSLLTAVAMVIGAGAAAAGPAPDPAGAPAARVEGRRVVHRGEGLSVRVPGKAVYAGGDRFILYGVADCEVHVFVEADSRRRVRRLYWIQFESYLPSLPDRRYDYSDGNERMDLWGAPAWVRAAPADTSRPGRAGSDRERVLALLKRSGFAVPADVLSVRLVRLPDDPQGTGRGRRELMLMYVEDLAPSGLRAADFSTDGKPNARWTAAERQLIERATKAFAVTPAR